MHIKGRIGFQESSQAVERRIHMRVVKSVFVLGTEKFLTDLAVGEAHISIGVVTIGQMQTVHIAVSALAVEQLRPNRQV